MTSVPLASPANVADLQFFGALGTAMLLTDAGVRWPPAGLSASRGCWPAW